MTARVFIDGEAGTTGLEIRQRLDGRRDLTLIRLGEKHRKDPAARAEALNAADAVILCLPDEAAKEAVSLIANPEVRVIDASTAFRTANDWTYGFPEMDAAQRAAIKGARRVSNPGCYPTGAIALLRPLVRAGLVPASAAISVNALSGYSGGGKSMIAAFEDKTSPQYTEQPVRTYALTLAHKHVPEMQKHAGLSHPPLFAPTVGRYYRGMLVDVPLQLWSFPGKPKSADLRVALAEAYCDEPFVHVAPAEASAALDNLDPERHNSSNAMTLYVFGNDKTQQARLVAVLDNLGKGASGAAVQNLNLMLGIGETTGLA